MTFLFLKSHKQSFQDTNVLIPIGNFILSFLALIASIPFAPEASFRFYNFLLIPYSILVPLFLSRLSKADFRTAQLRRFTVTVILSFTIFFFAITPLVRTDNDPGYYYPSSSQKGAEFVVTNLHKEAIWVRQHLHLIDYMASKRGLLLEGYMDVLQNENITIISLYRYIFLKKGKLFLLYFSDKVLSDIKQIIFNDYEDAYLSLAGQERYPTLRSQFETYVCKQFNKIYTTGSIRLYSNN